MTNLLLIVFLFLLVYLFDKNQTYKNALHNFEYKCIKLSEKIKHLEEKLSSTIKDYSELNENYYLSLNQVTSKTEEIADLKNKISAAESNLQTQQANHKIELDSAIQNARKDSVKRSRSVLRGQASEHLAPFVIKGTNPKDYRFMGNPIDYVCFDGLSDVLDKQTDEIKSVRFIDIKTGKSNLNKSQRRIRDAIKDGKVTFEIVNLDEVMKIDQTIKEFETKSTEES